MDERFDRIYLLKEKPKTIGKVKQLCTDYKISDNGMFEKAPEWQFAWAFGPDGLFRISPTTFLIHKPDFNSVEELEEFLDQFKFPKIMA